MKNFLTTTLLALLICACSTEKQYPKLSDPLSASYDPALKPFYHGVASGDPLQDAVVIWTKVTPEDSIPSGEVTWEISKDRSFGSSIKSGTSKISPERGYTAKIDVKGLEAGQTYYYRFRFEDSYSPIGRTKTAPANGSEQLNLAIVSCSNYEFGPFNAYGAIAERGDIDVVLHLGDYIYEYGARGYGDTTTGRFHEPPHEILTLSDYRTRYAQYRLDKDLREVHQNHPFITIWDDHEIANDAYKDGAQNHQANEGDYMTRRQIARKVYYEWLPIRESDQLYRSFDYGDLADLIMLDERLAGRVAPVESASDPKINSEDQMMLGTEQLNWFQAQLTNSDAQWKIIGNQVIFSYLNWGFPTFSFNLDSWDGYPSERTAIIDHLRSNDIKNVVFVTGDTHSSWALEVTEDAFGDYSTSGAVAVEYGTTSVNSGNSNDRANATDEAIIAHEQRIIGPDVNPQLKYTNLRDHGYLELRLTKSEATAIWFYTPDKRIASRKMIMGKTLKTPKDTYKILEQE